MNCNEMEIKYKYLVSCDVNISKKFHAKTKKTEALNVCLTYKYIVMLVEINIFH